MINESQKHEQTSPISKNVDIPTMIELVDEDPDSWDDLGADIESETERLYGRGCLEINSFSTDHW